MALNENQLFKKIIKNFSSGKPSEQERILQVECAGKNPLETILEVDGITKEGFGVLLSNDFFIDLNSRNLRKYLEPLKWKRINTKKQAQEEKTDPYTLFRGAINKLQRDNLYAGTGWRGISDKKNKNFWLYSLIEGWELFEIAGKLIKTNRYDLPDEMKSHSKDEIARISREISKITDKRIDLRKEIMKKGGIRTGCVPSRSKEGKFYDDLKVEKLPVKFYKIPSDFYYSTWFDLASKHSCKEKQMFITYLRSREEFFCAHDIAFMIACHSQDYKYHKDPYLVFTPFPRPTEGLIDNNARYRKRVFKRVEGKIVPINKIEREQLLFLTVQSGQQAKIF